MKIKLQNLKQQLKKKLSAIYLVAGDEILLRQQACDAIRAAAKQRGFTERESFHFEPGFDWQQLKNTSDNLSLFSDKKLVELNIPKAKFGKEGKAFLEEYLQQANDSQILLINSGKLEAATQRSKWVKEIETAHAFLPIWPVKENELPSWIQQQLSEAGFEADAQTAKLIAERATGNLLAAQQEIEKLKLLFPVGKLNIADVEKSTTDNSRFDVFALADSALLGDAARCAKILRSLKTEAIEPILILWSLTREIRLLIALSNKEQVYIWENKKDLYRQCLRHCNKKSLYQLLQQAGNIDQMIKGIKAGDVWDELLDICLTLSGTTVNSA